MRCCGSKVLRTIGTYLSIILKPVAVFLCPQIKAKCLLDFTSTNKLFDEYRTVSHVIEQCSGWLLYLLFIVTALQVPLPRAFQIFQAPTYGSMGSVLVYLGAVGGFQIFIVRMWLYYTIRKNHSVENIGFMQLLNQLHPQSEEKIFFWTKCISISLTCSIYSLVSVHLTIEIYFWHDIYHLLFILYHAMTLVQAARTGPSDLLTLNAYAVTGCEAVLAQMEELRKSIAHLDQFAQPMFCILEQYSRVIMSVKQLNQLCEPTISEVLTLDGKLLVVPFGSMLFVLVMSPASDSSYVFKYISILAAGFFAFHGYLITVELAKVYSMSMKLSAEINSTLARNRQQHFSSVIQLRMILEDMSSSKSHLCARDTGRVTQMDVYDSIISTLSTLTLFFSLYYE